MGKYYYSYVNILLIQPQLNVEMMMIHEATVQMILVTQVMIQVMTLELVE